MRIPIWFSERRKAFHVAFGIGIVVSGVVLGSGGVIIVVWIMVPGDGCGRVGLRVSRGVPGIDFMGGETVPVTGGGEGTGMLTCTGGTNGATCLSGSDGRT